MKLNDKYHWNGFIYELIYPGFVGSMIYELIPTTHAEAVMANYSTLPTLIKILITIFYCVDYLHGYGDMNSKVKVEHRSWLYLFCDIGSSLFFFFSFVMVKMGHIEIAMLLIAAIPVFFYASKTKNIADNRFHIPYAIISAIIAFVSIICIHHPAWINCTIDPALILCWFTFASLVVYCIYVFYYYEKFSRPLWRNTK